MPAVWKFPSTGAAYDACQCNENIKHGDILVIRSEGVVGIADTWPVAVTEAHGALHYLDGGSTLADYAGGSLLPSLAAAQAEIFKLPKPRRKLTIGISYESIDGVRKVKQFASVTAAGKWARERVGDHPTISRLGYAVSDDGVGKVRADGCSIIDLFPSDTKDLNPSAEPDVDDSVERFPLYPWEE